MSTPSPIDPPGEATPAQALLAATERLVYAGGIHATGVDAIVKASGVARKTLYSRYASKDALVADALRGRDERWMRWFIEATSTEADPVRRLLSIFPALRQWFESEGFHGCAFLNAAGEIGDPDSDIRAVSREHKRKLLDYLETLTRAACLPEPEALAREFLILIDGASAVALVFGGAHAAEDAERAARRLLACA